MNANLALDQELDFDMHQSMHWLMPFTIGLVALSVIGCAATDDATVLGEELLAASVDDGAWFTEGRLYSGRYVVRSQRRSHGSIVDGEVDEPCTSLMFRRAHSRYDFHRNLRVVENIALVIPSDTEEGTRLELDPHGDAFDYVLAVEAKEYVLDPERTSSVAVVVRQVTDWSVFATIEMDLAIVHEDDADRPLEHRLHESRREIRETLTFGTVLVNLQDGWSPVGGIPADFMDD